MSKESLSGSIETSSRSLKRTISVISIATLALAASACGSSKSTEKNNTSPVPGISQPKAGNTPGNSSPSSTEAQKPNPAPQTPSATSLSELGTNFCQNPELTNAAYQVLGIDSSVGSCGSITNSTDLQNTNQPNFVDCGSNQPDLTEWVGLSIDNSINYPGIDICIEPNKQASDPVQNRWQEQVFVMNNTTGVAKGLFKMSNQTINGRPAIVYQTPNDPTLGTTYVTETYDGPYFIRMQESNVPATAPNISFEFIKMMESNLH